MLRGGRQESYSKNCFWPLGTVQSGVWNLGPAANTILLCVFPSAVLLLLLLLPLAAQTPAPVFVPQGDEVAANTVPSLRRRLTSPDGPYSDSRVKATLLRLSGGKDSLATLVRQLAKGVVACPRLPRPACRRE